GALFHTIRSGVAGSQMPAFPRLTDDQVWQIVSYIRTLERRRPAAAAPQIVTATTRDGRQIRGVRRNEDTFSIQIVDAAGALQSFDKSELAAVRIEGPASSAITTLPASIGVSFDRLVKADREPQNWPMYWGDFRGTHYSALKQIDATNVQRLQAARTGTMLWETQVADTMLGYSLTSAPLIVKDKVLVGITGGEFGARGFLDAYDAATGRRLWRWYSVPAPGEPGNDTWAGDSWQHG